MAKHKNLTEETKPEEVVTEEVITVPTEETKPEEVVLEGDFSEASGLLPFGERTELAVEVRRSLPRVDLAHFVPGEVVAVITMAPGWNLNALVDHIREGYCGEKHS